MFRAILVFFLIATTAIICNGLVLTVYNLQWSGASLGNGATATGNITLDLTLLNNPGFTDQGPSPFVKDFSITITGSSAGDGTFGFNDFVDFFLDTNGGTLDFSQELVGQPTSGSNWGSTPSSGEAGDFNFFSNGANPLVPQGTFYFQITTNGSYGDSLFLTSFVSSNVTINVPDPIASSVCFEICVCNGVKRCCEPHFVC